MTAVHPRPEGLDLVMAGTVTVAAGIGLIVNLRKFSSGISKLGAGQVEPRVLQRAAILGIVVIGFLVVVAGLSVLCIGLVRLFN